MYEDDLKVLYRPEMTLIKDYHDLYLKCDNLLVADAFEELRNSSLTKLKLIFHVLNNYGNYIIIL